MGQAAVAEIRIRRPDPLRIDAEAHLAMAVQRAALAATLPGLHNPHTAEEDGAWIRSVFANFSVYLAFGGSRLVGIASRDGEWLSQLYVAPERTGQGIGQHLLDAMIEDAANAAIPVFKLWTFQRNEGARRFYERNGFVAVEFTDGHGNEEGEPDVRYERATTARTC